MVVAMRRFGSRVQCDDNLSMSDTTPRPAPVYCSGDGILAGSRFESVGGADYFRQVMQSLYIFPYRSHATGSLGRTLLFSPVADISQTETWERARGARLIVEKTTFVSTDRILRPSSLPFSLPTYQLSQDQQ